MCVYVRAPSYIIEYIRIHTHIHIHTYIRNKYNKSLVTTNVERSLRFPRKLCFRWERSGQLGRSAREPRRRAGSDAPVCEEGEAGDVGEASKFPRLEKCPIIPRYRNVSATDKRRLRRPHPKPPHCAAPSFPFPQQESLVGLQNLHFLRDLKII